MMGRRRGYTLMEMLVVVAIIVTASALLVPNVTAFVRSSAARAATEKVYAMAISARDLAETEGRPTELEYDSATRTFTLQKLEKNEDGESTKTSVREAALPEGVDPDKFRKDGADGTSADWKVTFRPDGTSTTGSVFLGTRTLKVDDHGRTSWTDENPDDAETEWPAGELEQRAGG